MYKIDKIIEKIQKYKYISFDIFDTLIKRSVEKPSDIVKVGDEILVKSLGFDKRGRLNLSRKEAIK